MLFSFNDRTAGTRVHASDLYDSKKGFGFITDKNLEAPGLSNHFTLPSYYSEENVVVLKENPMGIYVNSEEACEKLEAESGRKIPLTALSL